MQAATRLDSAHELWLASSPARAAMRQRIRQVQYPGGVVAACQQRPVLVYSLAESSAGFGAEAHGLILALNLAVFLNRTLVLPRADKWWYTVCSCVAFVR